MFWFTLFYLMSQSVSQSPQLFLFTYLCYLSSASTIKLLYWACHGPCHVCSRPLVHCEVVSAKSNCRCRILRVCFMCCIFFCDNISFCDIWCCSRRRLWCIKNCRRKLTDSTARKSWWSTTTTHAKSTTSRIVIFCFFRSLLSKQIGKGNHRIQTLQLYCLVLESKTLECYIADNSVVRVK